MKITALLFGLMWSAMSWGQSAYWVSFQSDQRESMPALSQEALLKRARRSIPLASNDFPVYQPWVAAVQQTVNRCYGASRWMNAVAVQATAEQLRTVGQLPFVRSIRPMAQYELSEQQTDPVTPASTAYPANTSILGAAAPQMEQIAAHFAFNQGYRGQGVTIAVFDGGFNQVDQMQAFQHLYTDGRLLGTWDLVADSTVYAFSNHGTHVLSIMAAYDSSVFVGAAPEASYYLFRTEDVSSETHLEEYNWLRAAEMADSLGVDLINSSLGYTRFDEGEVDYEYSDMDGDQAIVTQAADWAASKGILVVNSNGNYAQNGWTYMGAPADGDSVLAVGAVDSAGVIAPFSSLGPTYDGRIKPNVSARGAATALLTPSNNVGYGNGTSYSGPLIAGATACLWQQFPNLSNMEIIAGLEQSAHLAQQPDNTYGYGIPNYQMAAGLFSAGIDEVPDQPVLIFPNPGREYIDLFVATLRPQTHYTIRLIDQRGRVVADWGALQDVYQRLHLPVEVTPGSYLLVFEQGLQSSTQPWVKLP